MKTIFAVFIVLLTTLSTTQSLSCLPCEKLSCTPVRELNCKGGVTSGTCGCCDACAKIKDEACGGLWNAHGKCDKGLICQKKQGLPEWLLLHAKGKCVPRLVSNYLSTSRTTAQHCSVHASEILSKHFTARMVKLSTSKWTIKYGV